MRTNDERQEILYTAPSWCELGSAGVLVNVVIVCNLKRPSDHQPAIPAETGTQGQQREEAHAETETENNFFPNIFLPRISE